MHLPRSLHRPAGLLVAGLLTVLVLAGCGRSHGPLLSSSKSHGLSVSSSGPALTITKNTARLGGSDPETDAAAVATAVYPGYTSDGRPTAVVVADTHDWMSALAASLLMSAPIGAPLLYGDGSSLPSVSASALSTMSPTGVRLLGGAQVIRIGDAATPSGYKTMSLNGSTPEEIAAMIMRTYSAVASQTVNSVLIAPAQAPQYAMPAAGYSAFAGVPILFANDDNVPQATLTALATLNHPHMYILGPGTIIGEHVVDTLRHYGVVHRIRGTSPASNSVAFSSYNESGFGWDVYQPGHGLVFLNADQPLDAAAAAPLSASGDYGPQLILNSATTVPGALTRYLYQLQPGYVANTPGSNQVNAVYNHGWIIGDQNAISYGVQAQIDQDLEIKAESQAALSAAASSVGP